ncbi:MAG: hypothetical protein AABM31_12835, partial [Actinomycetota bacterium]
GGRTQRFSQDDVSAVAIDGERLEAQLLERLEDQAAALSETQALLATVEGALEAAQAVREQLNDELQAERAKTKRLGSRVQDSRAAVERVAVLEEELEIEQANTAKLREHLSEAWGEIQALNVKLQRPRGVHRLRRRS